MPDLKINDKELIRVLEQASAGALEGLQNFARRAIEEVKTVAAALEAIPRDTGELLTSAVIARVFEARVNSEQSQVSLGIQSQGIEVDHGNYYDNQPARGLKAGRYRILVLMLPVKE